jgi:RES domain-containing protein
MRVYRLCRERYADDLSGLGAERSGGRWNSKGNPVLYTAESRALCLAEMLVHLPMAYLPEDLVFVCFDIPDKHVEQLDPKRLPSEWQGYPYPAATRDAGDHFLRSSRSLAMRIWSAIVPGEWIYLLNPRHPEFGRVQLLGKEKFRFDARLVRR